MNNLFNPNDSLSATSAVSHGTLLPDFNSFHENYTKSIARGRNPKSIPRNSELWYHTKISNERKLLFLLLSSWMNRYLDFTSNKGKSENDNC